MPRFVLVVFVIACYAQAYSEITNINHKETPPEIHEGEECVKGNTYRLSCNTCLCSDDNSLICTKMACLNESIEKLYEKVMARRKSRSEQLKDSFVHTKREINETKNIRQEDKKARKLVDRKLKVKHYMQLKGKDKRKEKTNTRLPVVVEGAKCMPGKIYSKGCRKCFCCDDRELICTKNCNNKLSHELDESESAMLEKNKQFLPTLSHMGASCEPGKRYKVDCNLCFCSYKGDLKCTYRYCLDTPAPMKESKELSGKACTKDFTKRCTKCTCVDKLTVCKTVPNCDPASGKQLLIGIGQNSASKTLDIEKEKCVPHSVYTVHCNKCYCQKDGSLRCTMKVCLNHSQVVMLEKRYEYLEQNGL